MIAAALAFSIVISVGSFAWGYWQAGYEGMTRWIVAFGVLWLAAQWRRWRWVSTFGIFLALLLAIFGLWFNFIIGWMFSGAIFSLFAWDLTEFQHNLLYVSAREDASGMARRHIARVSLLALAGMLLVSLFIITHGQFTPDWGAFLLGLFVLGLLQFVAWFRR